ncbi:MAG: winged helix-turn-helix transcriptional regulator [Granulosicoccus sp.]
MVERSFYSDHPPRAEYMLTKKGKSLGPIFKSLADWGRKHTD